MLIAASNDSIVEFARALRWNDRAYHVVRAPNKVTRCARLVERRAFD
jgi:hypothetical protein